MARVQRANLRGLSTSTEYTSRAEVINIPTSRTVKRTCGCRGYLKILVLLILLGSIFIFFISFGKTSLWVDRKQASRMQRLPIFETEKLDVNDIIKEHIKRVEPDMDLFDSMIVNTFITSPEMVEPFNLTAFNPRYLPGPFKIELNVSKCLYFNEYAQTLVHSSSAFIEKGLKNLSKELKITPLCLLTNEEHHHGWNLTSSILIHKGQCVFVVRSIMAISLLLTEKLKDKEKVIRRGVIP